ncbi:MULTISPECIES: ribonuclease J [unclassified Campylobacter]|uniref:ribonuclease J n=1 Tax=unclassified Campylobacter TaxID=2593542 RepID=UPI0022E9DB12|nr:MULTISPECIES: ribonuclease J [unclassified Campylobacter]MDA3047956.1 ribonuclease J [Campylobacter sp. JMF_08 NE1]MDA3054809.1 ribonuclease J [Campylobacter sp. VBCF_07 NA4]MDA3061158.1 ribonuclease J [Campylobacter sp. VBCF_02 NA5]MDA3062724.1 ribonuclease J [Campylobacter sp. JMF_14 EL1]MDA3070758.1 ribonuclease J [Campylobacter sp. VBCF_08 NA3]
MEEKKTNNQAQNSDFTGPERLKKVNRRRRHRENLKKSFDESKNQKDEQKTPANENKKNKKSKSEKAQNLSSETAAQSPNSEEGAKKKKRSKRKTNMPKSLTGTEPWHVAMDEAIAANKAMHEARLYPLKNANSSETIRITPLGGLGEIGANMTIFETATSAIIVDVGMSFPDDNMPGVDILIPDFSYVRKIADKVKGIIITHAHEDHIGAMPYFFKEFQFPIYATPLPLGMISNKFEEHGLKAERSYFRPVQKRKIYKIGDFEVEFIHITHSIIDASALAITTKAGTIIHTGDFKIDHTPIDGYPTDLNRLAHYGDRGVMLLMSDSTNSHRDGITKSENSVGRTFDGIFASSKGRVIMSTFSSNIHRVYQAIERGVKYGRKVCVIGRSMERNLFTAMELGYVELDRKIFIDPDEVSKYPDNEVLIVTTGSQGETMSALYRMATDEHKYIKIKPTDQVIISAKAIPGNENSVSTVLNFLLKSGAKVAYQDFSEIHVSGHAAQEEQKLMLRLIKPKFFLPVHGEYNHIVKHRETAIECGIDEKNIYLMNDGDQMEICEKYLKRVKTVKTGKVFIDNQINKQISDEIVKHRQNLADAGVAVIIAQIDKTAKKLIKSRVITYGLVAESQTSAFTKDMEGLIEQFLANMKTEILLDNRVLESQIRQAVRKHIFRKTKKYPTIVPVIYLM